MHDTRQATLVCKFGDATLTDLPITLCGYTTSTKQKILSTTFKTADEKKIT